MRKKKRISNLIIFKRIILFFLILITINIVKAELIGVDPENLDEDFLGINPQNPPESPEELANQTAVYLKKEWGKILRNDTIMGPIIRGYEKYFPFVPSISRYLFGIEPSLSWIFILTLVIWITLINFIYKFFKVFEMFSGKLIILRIFSTLVIVIIISNIKLTLLLAEGIINAVSNLDIWWIQLITIVTIIIAFIVADMFSEEISKVFEILKEKTELGRIKRSANSAKEKNREHKTNIEEVKRKTREIEETFKEATED